MYDRRYEDDVLAFEASGALKAGSLIMRDRETDSWWSIMTSVAIGGEMEGAPLRELPVSEKTTWGVWRAKHPHTKVLAVVPEGSQRPVTYGGPDTYAEYFASDRVFRDLSVDDERLAPRADIYVLEMAGEKVAVPHERIGGGAVFDVTVPEGDARLFLHREPGASLFASTRGYWVPPALVEEAGGDGPRLLDAIDRLEAAGKAGEAGLVKIPGLDTFWYSFVLQNPGARLLGAD